MNENLKITLVVITIIAGIVGIWSLLMYLEEKFSEPRRIKECQVREAQYKVEIIVDRVNYNEKVIQWPALDPWGHVYRIEFLKNTRRLEARSKGPDGELYTPDDIVAVREIPE